MPDYLPRPDSEFEAWVTNFLATLNVRGLALGFTQAEIDQLSGVNEQFVDILNQLNAHQSTGAALSQSRHIKRDTLMEMSRAYVRRLQAHPALTDDARAAFRITIPSATRTPAPVPTTRPVVTVDTSQRLQQTLHFFDENTPNSRAKPEGVKAAEVRRAVADAPVTDPEKMELLALDTATPYVVQYTAADAGKVASYVMRWVNSRDEPGPWSQTVSATITG